jgi:superfamily II DNA or RNA helicase
MITSDRKFLILTDVTQLELEQLELSFTRKPDNWFIIKKKVPHWNGEIKFIDSYNRIPIGLWKEVQNVAQKYNFPLQIEGSNELIDESFNEEDFDEWHQEFFKNAYVGANNDIKFTPRWYQIEGAKRILKFRFCTEEISTSGGKTLIAFMVFRYLYARNKLKKFLYIVPNVDLVNQSLEKFYEYEEMCNPDERIPWKGEGIYSGAKKTPTSKDITFGTYQSLVKRDPEFFKDYNFVMVDETHHAKANSIQKIVIRCYNNEYRVGLSGTLPPEGSTDSFTIQAYLGPCVYKITSHDLINEGSATPVKVVGIELDYVDDNIKKKLYDLRNVPGDQKDGAKLLNIEKGVARENRSRFNYIVNKIANTTKNSLVLYGDIKNNYGRNIYDWLRSNTDKKVYYIDGSTKNENREYYKKQMEEKEDVIIVASVGTFSEGIDILNVHNIFIVESNKSEYIVRQILGRGMRLMSGKDEILVIDFSDNYEYGSGYQRKNYLLRHADEREKIYHDKRFPYKRFKVKI